MTEAIKSATRRALVTLLWGLIFFLAMLAPMAVPAEAFFRVERLEFVPRGGEIVPGVIARQDLIVQERYPRWRMYIRWSAVLQEIEVSAPNRFGVTETTYRRHCHGQGGDYYPPVQPVRNMPLAFWVGQDGCMIHDGTWRACAQWSIRFGVWSWVVHRCTEPFEITGRPPPRF